MQGKHVHVRTHQEDLLQLPSDVGTEDVKNKRFFTNTPNDPQHSDEALPIYQGLQPYYGMHKRYATGAVEGDVTRSPVNQRR